MSVTNPDKLTEAQLKDILARHLKRIQGDSDGVRANLSRANLYGANLSRANLSRANLYGANLSRANLYGAKLDDTTTLETGETWKDYREQVVPALLAAGGRSGNEWITKAWVCHSWDNCPMAEAFRVHSPGDVPILFRPRVNQFIKLFDAKLLPCPVN